MCFKNTITRYGSIAKIFHWGMFLLIAAVWVIGASMGDLENGPGKFKVYGLHKSLGVVVLMLVGLRLMWRMVNVQPVLPDKMKPIEKFMAHAAHWGLYALMFAMPLSGWLMSSAKGFPVSVFGLFVMPDLIAPDKELGEVFGEAHELLALAIIALVSLHVLAALLHHFYHKDNILTRMLPFSGNKQ